MIVGPQLTSLGSLHGKQLTWAIVSAAVAVAAIGVVVMLAAYALRPVGGTYKDFQHGIVFKKLREEIPWVGGGPASEKLRGMANNLQDLVAKYGKPGEEQADVQALTGVLTRYGIMLRVKQLYDRTMVAIGFAVPLVASAAVAYAYLSNPPNPTKAVDCISYYSNLHTLASGSPGLVAALQQTNAEPLPIVLDAQSKACGVDTNADLARLLILSR